MKTNHNALLCFLIINSNGQTAMTYGKQTALPSTEQTKEQKPMAKKDTNKPAILLTREGMEAAITEYFKLQLTRKAAVLSMEAEKLAVESKHEEDLNRLANEIESKFASIQNFCAVHRAELLPDEKKAKSFETVNAVVEFYFTPHSVETVGKESEKAKARRLRGLIFKLPGDQELDCEKYVRLPDPALNKATLLADRSILSSDHLRIMGITFAQTEVFSVKPKSELAEATTAIVGTEEVKQAA